MEDDLDIENDEVAVEDNDCDVDFDVESDDEEDKQDDETVIIDNSDITDIENDDLDNTIKYNSSNVEWTSHLKPVVIKPFTSDVGPHTILPHLAIGRFELFFTSSIIPNFVDQTNLYASHCMSPESFQSWEKVCQEEIEAFLGFKILMGLVKLPSLLDYWSKDETYPL
ncbi:PREDICTED: uncharacterized protein LOC105312233 [Amphimedon queenslandica]|uniref:PiggyBac transposable element-derived protein domain-containing protein n=2 Tax=Amphimedon queenslandica TaxID=400682 RepID=A0AAN0ILG0_AMPQE|nr:PREDICTED: uncharacterized protein LOC105312233 [Amphimedon queenslandica]|eukprot:XP_011403020.1 PREDICTED: uncharacterized protein LOC105312233 [Amphimedon queenslandica]